MDSEEASINSEEASINSEGKSINSEEASINSEGKSMDSEGLCKFYFLTEMTLKVLFFTIFLQHFYKTLFLLLKSY
uniref:Uncharacterized protein n=1 Tax=viral metagenome TaxID=1070528 RepID=A0A6C0F7J3_9ZZZZ